jgi:hypothetical protein
MAQCAVAVRRVAGESPACALDRASAPWRSQELRSREVIDHMVVNRVNVRLLAESERLVAQWPVQHRRAQISDSCA